MPVLVVLFRQAAWTRGGHLGGNWRERQPILRNYGFWLPLTQPANPPCGVLTVRQRDRDGRPKRQLEAVDAPASPSRPDLERAEPRRRSYLFRLSLLAGPTHNRCNNEDGLLRPVLAGRMGGGCEMSEKIYDVPAEWAKRAWADQAKYQEMYARSVKAPNGFWAEQAKRIDWIEPFTKVENASFAP